MTGTHRAKVTNAHLVMIYGRAPSAFRKVKLTQIISLEQNMERWVSFGSVSPGLHYPNQINLQLLITF